MAETTEEFVKNQREQCKANENLSQYGKSKSADYLAKKLLDACDRLEQLQAELDKETVEHLQIQQETEKVFTNQFEQQQDCIRKLIKFCLAHLKIENERLKNEIAEAEELLK